MTDEITQAATDLPNAEATPSVEGTGAQEAKTPDLDALLDQYRKETGSPAQPSAPAPVPDTVARSEFEALRAEIVKTKMEKEIDYLAKGLRAAGDIPDFLSDDDLVGIVDRQAAKDPALARAWNESANDPKSRDRLINVLGKELGKKFANIRPVDEKATADREAVAGAVRGASTRAPEGRAPDYSNLTDNEFRKEAEKYGITF